MGLLQDNVKKQIDTTEDKFVIPDWVTQEIKRPASREVREAEAHGLGMLIKEYEDGFRNVDTVSLLTTAAIEKVVWKELGQGQVCIATHFVSPTFVDYHLAIFTGNYWQGKRGEPVMYQITYMDYLQPCLDLMDVIRTSAQKDIELHTENGFTLDELFALECYRSILEGPIELYDAYEVDIAKRSITIIQGGSI